MEIETNGINLGDEVEDKLSGARGVVIGMTIWTTGCARAVIQPPVGEEFDKSGKYPDTFSCDVTMLRVTEAPNRLLAPAVDRSIGGPMPTPSRR
jgi:hypothetical protein